MQITSTVRAIPSEVSLGQLEGLRRECAVNLDHVHTVPKARMGPLIATLSDSQMADVRAALLFGLGCRR